MKKQLPLYRTIEKKKVLPLATFDIETTNIGDGEICFLDACVYYGGDCYEHFTSPEQLVWWIFEHPFYRYYAHNGSGFDFTFLTASIAQEVKKRGLHVKPIVQGESRLIGLSIRKGSHQSARKILEFRDSYALIPIGLEQAGEAFGVTTKKKDIGLGHGVTYNPDNPEHIAYLHADVRSLYEILTTFENVVLSQFGTSIGYTAGSTAISAWKAHIPNGHCYYRADKRTERFIRQGYYGGFVYPGRTICQHTDAITVDFNAAYAAIMKEGVPYGRYWRVGEFKSEYPGIYRVIATVPKNVALPCIPSRDDKRNVRWSTGTFETTITSLEIEFARKQGCTFDIIEGVCFERVEHPFAEFLEKTQCLEQNEHGAIKQVVKLMRNALYGKFGSQLASKNVTWLDDDTDRNGLWPIVDEDTGILIDCLAYSHEENDANYIMPHWAAWITAGQRIKLMQAMLDVGIQDVYYGDTDSITADSGATGRAFNNGYLVCSNNYGDVKVEKHWKQFQVFGPKNYHGILEDGEYHGKVKGIPRKKLTQDIYLAYNIVDPPEIEFYSVQSAFMSIKHPNEPKTIKRTRKLSTLLHSMSWRLQGDTIVPLHVEYNRLQ